MKMVMDMEMEIGKDGDGDCDGDSDGDGDRNGNGDGVGMGMGMASIVMAAEIVYPLLFLSIGKSEMGNNRTLFWTPIPETNGCRVSIQSGK